MTKIVLTDPASLTNETTFLAQIKANNDEIEVKSDTFLSRTGVAPNQMAADIDMNSHRLLNVLDAATQQEPVTLKQFQTFQQATLGNIQASLDFVFGSTPDLFMVRGTTTWGSRKIIGNDLPTPTTQSLGGVLALSPTLGQVIGGLDVNGNLVAASQINLQSTSSIGFTVGRQASAAQPAFSVNSGVANQITGIVITGNATAQGVDLTATGEANVPMRIDAAGTGTTQINGTATGAVLIGASGGGATTLFIARNTTPTLQLGSTGNVQGIFKSPGTGGFLFQSDSTGKTLELAPTASTDENWLRVISSSGANGVLLRVQSTINSNVPWQLNSRGTAALSLGTKTSNITMQCLSNAGTEDRFWAFTGGASGGAAVNPALTIAGTAGGFFDLQAGTIVSASDTSAFRVLKTVGLTTPAFRVNTNTASAITGIEIVSGATTTGVDINSIGDATTNTRINSAGAGTMTFNNVGTGGVIIGASAAGASGAAALTIASNTNPGITFGSSGNVAGRLTSQGSGGFIFLGATGSTLFTVDTGGATSGVVNSMICRGSVSGGGPSFIATGSDPSVAINFTSKAGGEIGFYTASLASRQMQIDHTASADRYLRLTGSAGGNPQISTSAGDLAIANNIIGTGQIRAHNATAAISGGSNATGFRMYSDGLLVTGGVGAPTISAAKGSIYLRTDGSATNNRMYVNTDGGTTWTNFTTAT